MKEKIKNIIPGYTVLPLFATLILQIFVFSGTKPIMSGAFHYNFESSWDLAIPFLPWTLLIYFGAYAYWAVSVIWILHGEKKQVFRFLSAYNLSLLISLGFYLLMPTTNTRPVFEVNDLWTWGMRMLYTIDTPDNLFPSLHCLLSWLFLRALAVDSKVPRWYQIFSFVFSILIFISTLTTKQHILIDILSGVLIAEACYALCRNEKIIAFYGKLVRR